MNTAAFQLTLGGFTHRCVVPAGDAKNTCIYPPPPLVDLQVAINRFLAEHNRSPKPFVWTADPNRIIAAASRGYQILDSIHESRDVSPGTIGRSRSTRTGRAASPCPT